MESARSLEVLLTKPSGSSDFAARFRTLEVEQTPDLSANDAGTTACDCQLCQRLVSRMVVKRVSAREPNGTTKTMLVCPECFSHYQGKLSTINCSSSDTQHHSTVNFAQIQRDISASQRGNQNNVMLVGSLVQPTPMGNSRHCVSTQSLVPTGSAPGPAVIVNARLMTQPEGQVSPTVILCETIADVPIQINHKNLKILLLNAFLPPWLKKHMNYPLGMENVESVRLMKGRNSIHLDNEDQAIFEHCFSNVNKLVTELCVLLVLDEKYVNEARAHIACMRARDISPTDLEYVDFKHGSTSKRTLVVTHTEQSGDRNPSAAQSRVSTRRHPYPSPHPLFKKRKLSNSGDQGAVSQCSEVLRYLKCTQTDSEKKSHEMTSLSNSSLKEALIAQHEPPSAAIEVHTISLPILFWLCPTKPLQTLISTCGITESAFGDWMHEVHPQNGHLTFSTADKPQCGAFKAMREGQIALVGSSPFSSKPVSKSLAGDSHAASVALKQPFRRNPHTDSDLPSSMVSNLSVLPENQVKELASDSLSIQWASTLLRDVYNFIKAYLQTHPGATCLIPIPQFRFVQDRRKRKFFLLRS
ncbi:hypothetical protein EI94DRAFT_1707232 [Lactarius quietus]|nr:hypothetical protein EI94DRAFT_1707232 [Lactarius quietus]